GRSRRRGPGRLAHGLVLRRRPASHRPGPPTQLESPSARGAPMSKETKKSQGRFAYEGLERVLHEKARLGLLTSLMSRPDGLLFGELKTLCQLTDGNLNRHLEALRE